MLEVEDDRQSIIDLAIKYELGDKDEIELFEQLSLTLELMEDDGFKVASSCIGDGLDFRIWTPYPQELPERVGTLFFNVDKEFDVSIKDVAEHINTDFRDYHIKINKF